MSSAEDLSCVYCNKGCKSSDSKPYPNPKAKDRIHNRCQIKKSLADKQARSSGSSNQNDKRAACTSTFAAKITSPSIDLADKLNEDNERLKAMAQAKKMNNMIEDRNQQARKDREKSSFFFDIKAGIAKPHEKRRFLNHRKICEMAPRYDDHGFKEDAVGRSYDHSGRDLDAMGGEIDDDGEDEAQPELNHKVAKRTYDEKSPGFNTKSKRFNNGIDLNKSACWFCLSSPDVEKHLIVTIGTHCYVTLAKGGLVDEHFLLIPIEHIGSITSRENSKDLLAEIEALIEHIKRYFASKSMAVVLFERNFRSVHWQIQAVPVSKRLLPNLARQIQEISEEHYGNNKYISFKSSLQIGDIIPPGAPYLHWRVEPEGNQFACAINVKDSFFPVQLPRIVLAHILNCPERIDWKKCCKSREQYLEKVAEIKDRWCKFETDQE